MLEFVNGDIFDAPADMDMLRTNAGAILLSDPEPDWLTSKGQRAWMQPQMSYVRYETTPSQMRDALADMGALPMGRRSDSGAPNLDRLVHVMANGPRQGAQTMPA